MKPHRSIAREIRLRAITACWLSLCLNSFAAERFEVASVRPHDPKWPASTMKFLPTGEVSISGMTLRSLILVVYGVRDYQIVGGPKWFDSAEFDIHAKSPRSNGTIINNQFISDQKLRLQGLFADRFQLKFHRESRERPVYLLSIDKNGLKITPANGPQPQRGEMGSITPWNLFITDLSQRVGVPIVDNTHLEGSYYIRLKYSTDDGHPAGIGTGRLDPTADGGPSLFTAIREQLGLTLKSGRGPVDVIVIESVSLPSTN